MAHRLGSLVCVAVGGTAVGTVSRVRSSTALSSVRLVVVSVVSLVRSVLEVPSGSDGSDLSI